MLQRLLALAFAVAVTAVACGGGDSGDAGEPAAEAEDPSPTVDPHAEDELARSLLLAVNDFPSGWSETPADDDQEENPFDECDRGELPGRTGAAETGDFSRGGAAEVSQEAAVFETPEDAISSLDRFQARGACLVEVINDGKLDDDEAEVSDAKFGALSFPTFGDKSDAYRLEFHVKAKGQTGLGSEGTGYIDIVRVIEGRLGFAIQASDTFSPFDTATLESIVAKADEKLADAAPPTATVAATPPDQIQEQPAPQQKVDEVVREAENGVLANAVGDNFFTLTNLKVSLNETTTFEIHNLGSEIHNMHIAGQDGEWNTDDDSVSEPDELAADEAGVLEFTPALAGTYTFRCDFHPTEMGGVIVVD